MKSIRTFPMWLGAAFAAVIFNPASALPQEADRTDRATPALSQVEFDRFSARRERTGEEERLIVSLRLRTAGESPVDCFVFVVARSDQATPRAWSIWPQQPAGLAISSAGHFHGAAPAAGHSVTLTQRWERITASFSEPNVPFSVAVIYVLNGEGRVLLTRPFRM
jgi:hypothetical protein